MSDALDDAAKLARAHRQGEEEARRDRLAAQEPAVIEARARFDADPEEWRRIGDQARLARQAVIEAACGENRVAQEAAGLYIRDLRTALAGPNPDRLEAALADRTALALFEADRLDRRGAVIDTILSERNQVPGEMVEKLDRRRGRAHARALAAARTLAVVRKLRRDAPAVAVQVNVAAGAGTAAIRQADLLRPQKERRDPLRTDLALETRAPIKEAPDDQHDTQSP